MSEPRSVEQRILDMLGAIADVRAFLVGPLTELGEAGKFVPEKYRKLHDLDEWRRMTGMRDWLAHGYFAVSRPVLWTTITENLGPLEAALNRILLEIRADNPK